MKNIKPIFILTTVPTKLEGERIASDLVHNRLAACVNILPKMTSIYRWENKVHKEQEYLLIIKTNHNAEKNVYNIIKESHSFEVPEIITININNIDNAYAKWLNLCINAN